MKYRLPHITLYNSSTFRGSSTEAQPYTSTGCHTSHYNSSTFRGSSTEAQPYTSTGCHTSHSIILPPLEVDKQGLEPNITGIGCHTSHSTTLPPSEVTQQRLEPYTSTGCHTSLYNSSTLKGQSNEIFDPKFFSSFKSVSFNQWVKIFSNSVLFLPRYS